MAQQIIFMDAYQVAGELTLASVCFSDTSHIVYARVYDLSDLVNISIVQV